MPTTADVEIEIREDPPESRKPLAEITLRPAEKSFWRSWLWAVLTAIAIVSTTVTVLAFTGTRAKNPKTAPASTDSATQSPAPNTR